ncbi:IclR family transcriptional regulator domain-containing protein [Streptomyces spiralis]
MGGSGPLHSTALDKVLLARPRPGEAGTQSLPPLRVFTDRTIVDRERLAEGLERVRAQRYALNDGESALGVRAVAVPVFDNLGSALCALAVRGTPDLMACDRVEGFLEQARACAGALEVLLLPPSQRSTAAVP